MTRVERTAVIAASPGAVWDVLSDFGGIVSWAPNVDHSCLLTEQESGVGTVRRIQAGRTTLVETVRTWEAGEALGYQIEGVPAVLRSVVSTWRIATHERGTTVTLTTEIDAGPRPPQRLIANIAGRKLGKASDDMIAGLAAHLEGTTQ